MDAVALETKIALPLIDGAAVLDAVRQVVRGDLAPLTVAVDVDGVYPAEVMRKLGAAGAFRQHLGSLTGDVPDFNRAIAATAAISAECTSTAFLAWCQNACCWYLENTSNRSLRDRRLPAIAAGEVMGATALSNPMKHFSGIEPLLLKGRRVPGGYRVNGSLPWVSNLGEGHCFGCVFALDGGAGTRVMAVVDCDAEGIDMPRSSRFVALEGTRTFALRFKDVFIADEDVLADPAEPMIDRIRPGFILLQIGIGTGLIHACLAVMRRADRTLLEVNRFLPDRPDAIAEDLAAIEVETTLLAETPWEGSPDFLRRLFAVRATTAELSLRASQAALLHAGARGYVHHAAAQRRVREALFVAILTPALKQLRRQIALMDGTAAPLGPSSAVR